MYIEIDGLRVGGNDSPLVIQDYEDSGIVYDSADISIPGRDGLYLGADTVQARTHTITLRANKGSHSLADAQALADKFTRAWRSADRHTPGAVVPMILETTRRRRIFGRPRKLSTITPDVLAMQGSITILAEFVQSDPVVYSADDTHFPIDILPKAQGGLKGPLTAPLRSTFWTGVSYRFVENLGDQPSRIAVKFYGPCKNPRLAVDGQVVALNATIAYDQWIEVDGRTGSVLRSDGVNVSPSLTSRTRLDHLQITPGQHEISYQTEDQSLTARAEIVFASAYTNI